MPCPLPPLPDAMGMPEGPNPERPPSAPWLSAPTPIPDAPIPDALVPDPRPAPAPSPDGPYPEARGDDAKGSPPALVDAGPEEKISGMGPGAGEEGLTGTRAREEGPPRELMPGEASPRCAPGVGVPQEGPPRMSVPAVEEPNRELPPPERRSLPCVPPVLVLLLVTVLGRPRAGMEAKGSERGWEGGEDGLASAVVAVVVLVDKAAQPSDVDAFQFERSDLQWGARDGE